MHKNNIFYRKRKLLISSLLFGIFMCLTKYILSIKNLEIFLPTQAGFFTSIFTGIMLLLGFLMAGVLKDYKESENIPIEMQKSIYIISREIYILLENKKSSVAIDLLGKLIRFIKEFKTEFIYGKPEKVFSLLDSFSDNFKEMDKEIAQPFMVRLRNEQANLRQLLEKMIAIRDTCFSEAAYVVMYVIVSMYLVSLSLLKIEHFWKGLFFVLAYSTTLFAVISLIKDMDNPFDYIENKPPHGDEINFSLVYKLEDELKYQYEILK